MRGYKSMSRRLLVAVLSIALMLISSPGFAVTATTRRVSVSSAEAEGNGYSFTRFGGAVSATGRYVVFESDATNLVPSDTNGTNDVFIRDRQKGVTRRVSVNSGEVQGNADSGHPSLSPGGRFVVFDSMASNLVGNDANVSSDVFIRDRTKGTTRRVSLNTLEVEGNGSSALGSISASGRFVVFKSEASNLVGNDANAVGDIFIRDRTSGTTRRISVNSAEVEGNAASYGASISADGRFVVFSSRATNIVGGDTNGVLDVFLRDRGTGLTRRLNLSSAGLQANDSSGEEPKISSDGRFVVFDSFASNLVTGDANGDQDVFIRNLAAGITKMVSVSSAEVHGNSFSVNAAISPNGRYVVFESASSNLVGTDTNAVLDVFRRDRKAGTTWRVSVTAGGSQGNGVSRGGTVSGDGRFVVFTSQATNMVSTDANGTDDVFIRGSLF
jgi:hypothetical protein